VLKKQYVVQAVTYLLDALDILPLGGLDQTCPALAQGPNRLSRSLAFNKYINEHFGAAHQTALVDGCGHNERCMFMSPLGVKALFPDAR
jgi:hypothetical protein